jgi:hypothetical protein
MQTRVGQVRIRYRVPAGQLSSATLTSLQSVARQKIADACDSALEEVFADDPTVYVLRKVNSRVAVLAGRKTSETNLAEQWGRNLCTSVVKAIVRNDDDENLVRFENQSDFISSFLTRLVSGNAWDLWYFGAFTQYRRSSTQETILSVLEANRDLVSEVFTRLKRANVLDLVLASLGRSGHEYVWTKLIRGVPVDEQTGDAFRIFVRSAFTIADALSIWKFGRPSESEVLDSYWRTKPISPDWTNGTSLAEAVNSLLRFMAHEGMLDTSSSPDDATPGALRELLAAKFDWLDTTHLFNSVMSIFSTASSVDRQFTLRPRRSTPAQDRILMDLLVRVRSGNFRFNADAPHESLLLLLTDVSELADGPSQLRLEGLLESIVMGALAIQETPQPRKALQQLQFGELPSTSRVAESRAHLKVVLDAGEPALALVAEIVKQSVETFDDGVVTPSACAGLFLLVRVIQDLRIGAALKECGCKSIQPLLVGLATAICRDECWCEELLDSGAAIWSGINQDEASKTVATLESLDWKEFITAISETISGQRLFDPTTVDSPDTSANSPYSPSTIASLNQVSALLLKAWARWLPGLAHSSHSYLLANFIHRPGTVIVSAQRITILLEPRSLDEILRLAGYLADTPPVAWLDNRPVSYRIGR